MKSIACQAAAPKHNRHPLPVLELLETLWTEMSLDFAGLFPDCKYATVVIGDNSKYLVINILQTLPSIEVVHKLRAIFAQFSIPAVLKTGNGPPFQSRDFSRFANELGFRHHRITTR